MKNTFCSSPWFHAKITHNGSLTPCRWGGNVLATQKHTLDQVDPEHYFQHTMKDIRKTFLDGEMPDFCKQCKFMESNGKVSGRQRQLNKTGIAEQYWTKSFFSSPWHKEFDYSSKNQGHTNLLPQDWQIDIGNYCNSACLMCNPDSSTRLGAEFKKLGLIAKTSPGNWTDDPLLVDKFIAVLEKSPRLSYLHFLGGEPLLVPAFQKILEKLIKVGLHKTCSIGFTTNLTLYNQSIIALLSQFKEVNVGLSIECLHPVNEYIRYGSEFGQTKKLLDQWVVECKKHKNFLIQLRITPTILSVLHLDTVFEYAYKNEIGIESCNFIRDPKYMRPSVLPEMFRQTAIDKLLQWLSTKNEQVNENLIINSRNPDNAKSWAVQEAHSYINYLHSSEDESYRLRDLIAYLHIIESNRKNCVLDYIPEYDELFRSNGYR